MQETLRKTIESNVVLYVCELEHKTHDHRIPIHYTHWMLKVLLPALLAVGIAAAAEQGGPSTRP